MKWNKYRFCCIVNYVLFKSFYIMKTRIFLQKKAKKIKLLFTFFLYIFSLYNIWSYVCFNVDFNNIIIVLFLFLVNKRIFIYIYLRQVFKKLSLGNNDWRIFFYEQGFNIADSLYNPGVFIFGTILNNNSTV